MTALSLSWVLLAQTSPTAFLDRLVDVDFNQMEAREAIVRTLDAAGIPRSRVQIGKDVNGVITVVLKRQYIRLVLRAILNQVDAVLEERDGNVTAFYKENGPTKFKLNLELPDVEVRTALKHMFDAAAKPYRIDAKQFTYSRVNLNYEDTPFEFALDRFVVGQGLRYRVEKGTYIIF